MQQLSAWDDLLTRLASVRRRVKKSATTHISASQLREDTKALVQHYFRQLRPELESLNIHSLQPVDEQFQVLLPLANRVNRRSTYIRTLTAIESELEAIEAQREFAIGMQSHRYQRQSAPVSDVEDRIIETLNTLVPSAALSYRQALMDLGTAGRHSFRGTAAELREALREVLDHLAPDDGVQASLGFKLEPEQTGPTMRQKVRFILKSRNRPNPAIVPAETATDVVDELTASLVRSVYTRASMSTHVSSGLEEVRRIKAYVDTILTDLLEV